MRAGRGWAAGVVGACALALWLPLAPAALHAAPACTKTWNLPISGAFGDPLAWSPLGAPGPTDVACVDEAVAVTGAKGVAALEVGAKAAVDTAPGAQIGSVDNHGTLVVPGDLHLTDGDLRSTGTLRLDFPQFVQPHTIDLGGGALITSGSLDVTATTDVDIAGRAALQGTTTVAGVASLDGQAELGGTIAVAGTLYVRAHTVLAGSVTSGQVTAAGAGEEPGPNGALEPFVPNAHLVFAPTFAGKVAARGLVVVEGVLPAAATLAATASNGNAYVTNWPGTGDGLPFTNRGTIVIQSEPNDPFAAGFDVIGSCPEAGSCTPGAFRNEGLVRFGPGGSPPHLFGQLDDAGRIELAPNAFAELSGTGHRVSGTIDIAADARLVVSGSLALDGGSITGTGALDVRELRGSGTVTPATELGHDTPGVLAPGASPGRIELTGDLIMDPTDTLVVELGGYAPGTDYDQLVVDGSAQLAGTMEVQLLGGFVPSPCDDFHVIAGKVSDTFETEVGFALGGTLELLQEHGADGLHLVAVDIAGPVTVAQPSVTVTEGGPAAHTTVCLRSPPSTDVTFGAAAAGTTVAPAVTSAQLPVDLQVSAIDDAVDQPDRVVTAHGTTTSADPPFDGLPFSFSVTIIDNDVAAVLPATVLPPPPPVAPVAPVPPSPAPVTPGPAPAAATPAPPPASPPAALPDVTSPPSVVAAPAAPATSAPAPATVTVTDRGPGGHRRAALPSSVPTATSLHLSAGDLARSGGLWLLLILLLLFPSQLVNSTIQENYEEITAGLDRWRGRWRRWRGGRPEGRAGARAAGAVAAAGLLYAWLDPDAELLDRTTVATAVGLAVALGVVLAAYELPRHALLGREGRPGTFSTYPVAAGAALACVVLTRVTGFQPGYLFGLMAGFRYRDVEGAHEGRAIAISSAVLLALSLGAWLVWIPVADAATGGAPSFVIEVLDVALAGIFVAGIESIVFVLVPLRFLDGEKVWRWSRRAWFALLATSLFLFVHVLIGGTDYVDKSDSVSAVAVAVAFVGFGSFSITFWWYWKRRERASHLAVPVAAVAVAAPERPAARGRPRRVVPLQAERSRS